MVFWLCVTSLATVGEAIALFFMWVEKEHWLQKFLDAKKELYPWDYTREEGWR